MSSIYRTHSYNNCILPKKIEKVTLDFLASPVMACDFKLFRCSSTFFICYCSLAPPSPWSSTITLVALFANLLALPVLLIMVLSTSFLICLSNRINKKDIVCYGLHFNYYFNNVLLGLYNFSRKLHITQGMDYI